MRKLFIAMILATLAASSAQAQLATAPEGAIIPNGALHYVVPSGIPIVAWAAMRLGHLIFRRRRFTRSHIQWFRCRYRPHPGQPVTGLSLRIPLDPHRFFRATLKQINWG